MLFEVLRLVGMKHGTGIGTGTRMGYGAGVEYIATGVGVYIGTGHGTSILLGSQFSSTNKDALCTADANTACLSVDNKYQQWHLTRTITTTSEVSKKVVL